MERRGVLRGIAAVWITEGAVARADSTKGQRLADAARAQVGVTTGYDPSWARIAYPGGDVPRSTGVCADVVIRAARDALGIDLQKLVHEDMVKHFDAYPSRVAWGEHRPDPNIDHRRVPNLETFWTRAGSRLWAAKSATAGDAFPLTVAVGDILTWLLDSRLPHVGIATDASPHIRIVHNIGRGAEETPIEAFFSQRAAAHYRWPIS